MPKRPVKDRLAEAAFALFEEHGYDATTVEHIAERAGVGRTTFFRAFPTKEDVIFPDHAAVLDRIRARPGHLHRRHQPGRGLRGGAAGAAVTT